MEKEFDKQIDAILRNATKGYTFAESPKNHLDTDEISLFAENLLPINARKTAIEHFADCNRCRSILVDVSAFNQLDLEISNVNVIEKKASFLASFKNWFSLPQIGFAMGALTLLFVGIIGFIALKNNQQEIAQLEEMPKVASDVKLDKTNQLVSNKIQNSNAASSVANIVTTNAATNTEIAKASNVAINPPSKPAVTNSPVSPIAEPKREDKTASNSVSGAIMSDSKDNSVADESVKSTQESETKSVLNQPSPVVTARTESSSSDQEKMASAPASPSKKQKNSENDANLSGLSNDKARSVSKNNTKIVSGKTFRNEKGVWIDSNYNGGTVKNVSKGTNDFKKLDSGLRNIANNFSETVIIVWKSKAYQIQ